MPKIEIEIPKGKRAEWVDGVLKLVDDTPKEPNEVIKNYEDACEYFGLVRKNFTECAHVYKSHLSAIEALNKLFLITEAWNRIDGFVPDFSYGNQHKYFPLFIYNNVTASFVYTGTDYSTIAADTHLGPRICFKTEKCAEQFGNQFIDLWNKVLLP